VLSLRPISDPDAGALAGDYAVTVRKFCESKGRVDVVRPEVITIPKNQLSSRYAAPKTSGLSATVTARAENTFEFYLTGRPEPF
jgi:hypothetical protein